MISPFVVGNRHDNQKTESEEDLCSCMDAASGTSAIEAAILDCIIG